MSYSSPNFNSPYGVVVGGAGLACAAVAECATAIETGLGIGTAACVDGNCTNEAEALVHSVNSFVPSLKHFPEALGNWAKFSSSNAETIREWIRYGLENPLAVEFQANGYVRVTSIINEVVGTKDQTAIRIIFDPNIGQMITAFPVK